MLSQTFIQNFVKLATKSNLLEYSGPSVDEGGQPNKEAFHRQAKKLLKEIAGRLHLNGFEIRSNKAGPGSVGEITLHGERIYIQLSEPMINCAFMWRLVKGRKDYTGLRNQWMAYEKLLDLDNAIAIWAEAIKNHPEPITEFTPANHWQMVTL